MVTGTGGFCSLSPACITSRVLPLNFRAAIPRLRVQRDNRSALASPSNQVHADPAREAQDTSACMAAITAAVAVFRDSEGKMPDGLSVVLTAQTHLMHLHAAERLWPATRASERRRRREGRRRAKCASARAAAWKPRARLFQPSWRRTEEIEGEIACVTCAFGPLVNRYSAWNAGPNAVRSLNRVAPGRYSLQGAWSGITSALAYR